jgi:hypothetical protein
MAAGVAIVAIPSQDDYVWKISSEKVPHMTLLHFDDVLSGPEWAQVDSFLAHVVETEGSRFGMSVDHRGTLGPEDADVLFFDKHWSKDISRFRTDLLANPLIRKAYNSSQQYPGWTPHLTLGYPTSPAKSDNREYPGFSWVNFDKIALWLGDYDGPEYQLKDREEAALAMSDIMTLAGVTLSHYGVKGMKWGVRKDGSISSTTTRNSHLRRKATDVTAKQKPGQYVRTSGGKRQTASEEAVRVAATRQLAKKSTTDALSNKQLQEAVTRMNLEQQYHTLSKKTQRQTRGQRFAQKLLGKPTPVDKNGNPLPGTGSSFAAAAASAVGEVLKNK